VSSHYDINGLSHVLAPSFRSIDVWAFLKSVEPVDRFQRFIDSRFDSDNRRQSPPAHFLHGIAARRGLAPAAGYQGGVAVGVEDVVVEVGLAFVTASVVVVGVFVSTCRR
jgi:hypothetical protein